MRTVIATMESASPISFSKEKDHSFPRLEKENAADHELRTWRERCHYDENRNLFIPPMMFKNCISAAAKYLSMQVPGKGKSTYTKFFDAGVLIPEGIPLGIKVDDVEGEWFFVDAQGRVGGTSRVWKCFPVVRKWSGDLMVYILDDNITEEVFAYHLKQAGAFIGIGRFRPRNRGFYGRFSVKDIIWQNGN